MLKNKIIIVNIAFNVLRKFHVPPRPQPETVLTKEWIENRMDIFMNYAMKSLSNQTNNNFIALVRYEDCTKNLIREALRKYDKVPNNVIFVKNSKFSRHIKKLIIHYDYFYLVRLDSDDMYHKTYIQRLYDFKHNTDTKVLINRKGFVYNSLTNQMATYSNPSPPFYTLIYKTDDYLNGVRYSIPKHRDAIKLPHKILKGYNFIVNIHSINTSSKFNNKNKIMNPSKVSTILKEFKGE
ncbi:glycosyltransferase family A protein [Alteribacillus sp. YIM 98480]|uniref:glycosyltransferase family A protein n=1 Tax=Alteribacillus sp. YIM 98480 TaxID=2606599 RepID=UPI00131AA33C|nr:glycosyltransferase family A protein [Alteribacillus sp. YIM 98480]